MIRSFPGAPCRDRMSSVSSHKYIPIYRMGKQKKHRASVTSNEKGRHNRPAPTETALRESGNTLYPLCRSRTSEIRQDIPSDHVIRNIPYGFRLDSNKKTALLRRSFCAESFGRKEFPAIGIRNWPRISGFSVSPLLSRCSSAVWSGRIPVQRAATWRCRTRRRACS